MLHNKIKDHSVSGEFFELIRNLEFGYLQTHPRPDEKKLYKYYDSEDYISHTDAKRNLFEKMYHWVRSYMLSKKIKLVEK